MIRGYSRLVFVVILLLLNGIPAIAARWETPADFENAQIAAEAAVMRGPRPVDIDDPVVVAIIPLMVEVKGISAVVDGRGSTVVAAAISVERAMAALDAKMIDRTIVVELSSDVLFDFDRSDIKPEAAAMLDKVAVVITSKSAGKVLIEGHTDAMGSEPYNQKLSERRSMAVKKWLVDHHHFNPGMFITRGWGETRPVAPNTHEDGSDNPEGRARNRRVVITISTVK